MTTNRRHANGQIGEDAAAKFLQTNGFRLRERNWRPGNQLRGEVDCIAYEGRALCFVEVKTRLVTSDDTTAVAPQEAVTLSKQRQISRLANAYISYHRLHDVPCRFDVIEVWLQSENPAKNPRLVLHRNAFDYCGEF